MARCTGRRGILLVVLLLTLTLLGHQQLRWEFLSFSGRERNLPPYGSGFLLTLDYTGQLVAGVRALLSQQCWVTSFKLPLTIVEPFTNDSRLGHSHDLWYAFMQKHGTVRFSDHFHLQHFNEESLKSGDPLLATWREFIHTAPRKVILLTIEDVHHAGCLAYEEEMCIFRQQNNSFMKSFFTGCQVPERSKEVINDLKKLNFHVVRVVCLNCQYEMSPQAYVPPDLITRHIFGSYDAHSVTLVVNKWRFSLKITRNCEQVETCKNEKIVLPQRFIKSPALVTNANWYISSYFGSSKVIAIMIRVEWFFISHRKDEADPVECMEKVIDVVRDLQKKGNLRGSKTFLSMDIGAYGSGTFKYTIMHTNTSKTKYDEVLNKMQGLVKKLFSDVWTFDDWEKSFRTVPNVPNERGYIATLQGTIASKADCLILMGGGHFQHLALQGYLDLHPKVEEQCIKYVCMAPPFRHLFKTV